MIRRNMHRVKLTVLIAVALMAVSIPLATTTQAATSGTTVSQQPDTSSYGCWYDTGLLHYHYFEADGNKSLDWTASNNGASNSPLILEPVSSSSALDCFKPEGGTGDGRIEFQLANSDLCLNIAGDSHSIGAWVVLWPCNDAYNEQFTIFNAGLNDMAIRIKSYSSGLCMDLTNGSLNQGTILNQNNCKYGDLKQAWFETS
jgi:Ricin-type beta-trefoil lectin domain-like